MHRNRYEQKLWLSPCRQIFEFFDRVLSDFSLFLEGGASNDPCSEIYAGPKPYSEPETLALTEFVKTFNLKFYFAFHSYSQQILYPFVSGNNQVFYKY